MKSTFLSKTNLKKKSWMFLCMLLFIFLRFGTKAVYADNTMILLSRQYGILDTAETTSFFFQVPVDAKVTIAFEGLNDDYKGTYGGYILQILAESGDVLFEQAGSISFDDTNVNVDLKKGAYYLILQEDDDFEFEYLFSIKAKALTGNVPVQQLKLNKSKITLGVDKTYTLKGKFSPEYATDNQIWSSSNKNVVSVDNNGKITAKGLGNAVITLKMGTKTAKCTVIVNNDYLELIKGETESFTKAVKNIKGYKKAKWKLSQKSVATLKGNTKIEALSHGKAKATAKIGGKTYTITVYVYEHDVLVRAAQNKLKSMLKYPASLTINRIIGKGNYVRIDYSAMNGFGGYNREYFSAWYEKGKLKYMFY